MIFVSSILNVNAAMLHCMLCMPSPPLLRLGVSLPWRHKRSFLGPAKTGCVSGCVGSFPFLEKNQSLQKNVTLIRNVMLFNQMLKEQVLDTSEMIRTIRTTNLSSLLMELIEKAKKANEKLPDESRFDSNCITPGTEFMERLQQAFKHFVKLKLSTDPAWKHCRIILSGHEVCTQYFIGLSIRKEFNSCLFEIITSLEINYFERCLFIRACLCCDVLFCFVCKNADWAW